MLLYVIMATHTSGETPHTVFENEWLDRKNQLFRSERHKIMVVPAIPPKLPFHVVVAPHKGKPGEDVRFSDLPRNTRLMLHEVADTVEAKMSGLITPEQRIITHTEGFGVRDHAHIVLGAAEKGEGINLYTGESLGALALHQTIEAMTFSSQEAAALELRLDRLHYVQ